MYEQGERTAFYEGIVRTSGLDKLELVRKNHGSVTDHYLERGKMQNSIVHGSIRIAYPDFLFMTN